MDNIDMSIYLLCLFI